MARTLDQVLSDLNPYYKSSEDVINAKISGIPGQTDAAIAGADAKLLDANDSILAGARRRGLGFSGIPVGEQAKYAATTYAPAVLSAKTQGQDQALSLQESLNQLTRDKLSQGQSIYDQEVNRDFQERQFQESIRQFNEQQAAAAKAAAAQAYQFGASLSQGRDNLDDYAGTPTFKVNGSSYAFYDANGKPVSAITYASQTGYGVRKLLSEMAAKGDKNASVALQYVGNDGKFGNAPASVKAALSAIGASGSYATAAPTPAKVSSNPATKISVLPSGIINLGPKIGK